MATILLSAVGGAVGASFGGSVLGLSGAVIGRAVGATVGRLIDDRIMGVGSRTVDVGRIERFRLTGASEGTPIAKAHGRIRVAGQVIWATRFLESVTETGGGKGAPSQPTVRTYSYSVSLAIGLCEGPITRIGRIWADGAEVAKGDLTLRLYTGTETQAPDPKMEAVEGAGQVPAYRGLAYVVIENLDLGRFGNRVPQFNFEVIRTGEGDLASKVNAVAIIPGTGEYALATSPVHFEPEQGAAWSANINQASGETDFLASLDALNEELPGCNAASLIVSWFGDDLRCGQCSIRPMVEQSDVDGEGMPWVVSGVTRGDADSVPMESDAPVYGGTPADASVVEAIAALKASGKAVTFYPFILMTQGENNGRADPWTGAADQPSLPWRGRITTEVAPLREGTTDGTSLAATEVFDFFGTVAPGDFTWSGTSVGYAGPAEFSYRRFILHYAQLCAAAGGVDAFCIGSEMRGLTQIRDDQGFPAVDALRALAADVRSILGPDTKIGYAADWSEYFGYQPQDGSGDVHFHLDPLWSDPEIDFVGIDNYMPLSDWREGEDHLDAAARSPADLEYLKANIEGGEGFDWYYRNPGAEALQDRSPIEDGAHGEPWVFRYKDLRGWWSNPHHERLGGVRQAQSTGWVPGSKPIWFTELGCAAIDKGTNQPNKFLDPKSSESALPKFSDGGRDDALQAAYLTAMTEHWSDPANNPVSGVYGGPMVATDRMFAWAWDARPWPAFPGNPLWSDGDNYARGHWLSGRVASRSLASVIREICADHGVTDVDTSEVYGILRGYAVEGGADGRSALQPLLLGYGIDAVERDGRLIFRSRTGRRDLSIEPGVLAARDGGADLVVKRDPESEVAGRLRVSFVEAEGDYAVRAAESIFPDDTSVTVAESEVPMVLTEAEGRGLAERYLAEARVGREKLSFSLPPSIPAGAGDIVEIDTGDGPARYRIDRIEDLGAREVEAVRVEPGLYRRGPVPETRASARPVLAPVPVRAEIADLPLGELVSGASTFAAVTAQPWPGEVAIHVSDDGEDWRLETIIERRAVIGTTLTDLPAAATDLIDRGEGLRVRLVSGTLGSIDDTALLGGGNVAAIGGAGQGWEVFQFRDAVLVEPGVWSLSHRLRGQLGTETSMAEVRSAGATVIVLDGALMPLDLPPDLRGITRQFRFGPASKPVDHASHRTIEHASDPVSLRPWSPVHLRALHDADGSVTLTWIRRTRVGGDAWTDWDTPLGETFERYRLRILSGGIILREVETTVPTWRYDESLRQSDGTTGAFEVEVAQISDRYGPGATRKGLIDG